MKLKQIKNLEDMLHYMAMKFIKAGKSVPNWLSFEARNLGIIADGEGIFEPDADYQRGEFVK